MQWKNLLNIKVVLNMDHKQHLNFITSDYEFYKNKNIWKIPNTWLTFCTRTVKFSQIFTISCDTKMKVSQINWPLNLHELVLSNYNYNIMSRASSVAFYPVLPTLYITFYINMCFDDSTNDIMCNWYIAFITC